MARPEVSRCSTEGRKQAAKGTKARTGGARQQEKKEHTSIESDVMIFTRKYPNATVGDMVKFLLDNYPMWEKFYYGKYNKSKKVR